ncbi:phosphatase PAP2 family protein [Candidatus Peregrinibacteria bacterium]|nr:phosphatase PAP2 family protein [Candidatus Peregrinibacteria bacterium]
MKKNVIFIIAAAVLIIGSFYFNDLFAAAFGWLHNNTMWFENAVIFYTGIGMFVFCGAIAAILAWRKKYSVLVLATIAFLAAFSIGHTLKPFFHVNRPEAPVYKYIFGGGYSFPSIHAMVFVAILPFINRIFKNNFWRVILAALIIIMILTRLYLGVHRLSDTVFGIILGALIGIYVIALEHGRQISEKIIEKIKSELEVRRQLLHLAVGIVIASFVYYNFLNIWLFLAAIAIGGAMSFILKYKKIPIVSHMQKYFEREHDIKRFPGKGLIYMVAGSALSYAVFGKEIAVASILILAFGDSLTHIIGKYFGSIRSPFDETKHVEGTVIAFFITALVVMKFASFNQVVVGTLIAMAVEMVPIKIWKIRIDDNLIIPVLAGAVMTLF